MGSKFFDLHLADPGRIAGLVRGDQPDLVEQLQRRESPPDPRLEPAFALMARGTFVFLPKGREHPEGLLYSRAVEYLLVEFGERRWGIEFYPDEDEDALWQLAFGRCEAAWLDLPHADTGIATIGWRSPKTCGGLAWSLARRLADASFNPRYISAASLTEVIEALERGSSSEHGLFAIYQA